VVDLQEIGRHRSEFLWDKVRPNCANGVPGM
jgi:hypothetical protein